MPHRSRLRASLLALMRGVLLVALLAGVAFGAKSAAFYARLRRLNAAQSVLSLPSEPRPDSTARLLVFAPHCDDETLGSAGLIQQTVQAGGLVHVAILTNGDAFPAAAQREFRRFRLQPADYARFASLRRQESKNALQSLGVPANSVQFFGYPDRGLMPLWNNHWTADKPYASPTTQRSATDAASSAYPDAPFCGRGLLENIKTALRNFRPTLITVTHPAEDHADHAAAAAFVALALRELQSEPESAGWARQTHLRYYLVHCGDWPVPPTAPDEALTPPAALIGLDTAWRCRPLTLTETQGKADAIARYSTQTAMMGPFLRSFARSNEIYGERPESKLPRIADCAAPLDANAPIWAEIPPALRSPLADNLAREMEGGADIAACRVCRDSKNLYLRIETREAIRSRFVYTVRIRAIGPCGESNLNALILRPTETGTLRDGANDIETTRQGRTLTLAVPLKRLTTNLPLCDIAFSVETALAGVPIDQTGITILDFGF